MSQWICSTQRTRGLDRVDWSSNRGFIVYSLMIYSGFIVDLFQKEKVRRRRTHTKSGIFIDIMTLYFAFYVTLCGQTGSCPAAIITNP